MTSDPLEQFLVAESVMARFEVEGRRAEQRAQRKFEARQAAEAKLHGGG